MELWIKSFSRENHIHLSLAFVWKGRLPIFQLLIKKYFYFTGTWRRTHCFLRFCWIFYGVLLWYSRYHNKLSSFSVWTGIDWSIHLPYAKRNSSHLQGDRENFWLHSCHSTTIHRPCSSCEPSRWLVTYCNGTFSFLVQQSMDGVRPLFLPILLCTWNRSVSSFQFQVYEKPESSSQHNHSDDDAFPLHNIDTIAVCYDRP